jgi:hypothetical protein
MTVQMGHVVRLPSLSFAAALGLQRYQLDVLSAVDRTLIVKNVKPSTAAILPVMQAVWIVYHLAHAAILQAMLGQEHVMISAMVPPGSPRRGQPASGWMPWQQFCRLPQLARQRIIADLCQLETKTTSLRQILPSTLACILIHHQVLRLILGVCAAMQHIVPTRTPRLSAKP